MRLTDEGVAPADGEWFDGRIELRTVDGIRLVSYLVKNGSDGRGWKCQNVSGNKAYSFFKDWADSPEFCTRLHTRYWQVRDRFAACMMDGGLIDQYTNFLYEACLANSAKWDDKNNGWNVYNSSAFTAAIGEPNCVSFIAYNSSGEVVARNYALVTQERFFGTTIKLR